MFTGCRHLAWSVRGADDDDNAVAAVGGQLQFNRAGAVRILSEFLPGFAFIRSGIGFDFLHRLGIDTIDGIVEYAAKAIGELLGRRWRH